MKKDKGLKLVEGPRTDLVFEIQKADTAARWISHYDGRFSELKQGLITQIATLRKSEALCIPAPDDAKEQKAMQTAAAAALKKAGFQWTVRYSKLKKCLVILHASRFNGKKVI